MTMTQEELKKIIENHQHWLNEDCSTWSIMKADLSGANLNGAYLSRANLSGAGLSGADLSGAGLIRADLSGADLSGADLSGADLIRADLSGADLSGANLSGANLSGADLSRADLSGANLIRADLSRADLSGANLDEHEKPRLGQVLKKPITGYKMTMENVIITATIPAGAIVFCINGSKCRTNKARIIDMGGHNKVLHSRYDPSFEYRLLQDIEIEDFNLMYNVECASGFHFFKTKKEAMNY